MNDGTMKIKYPATSIDEMCDIIKSFGIVSTEYTDCTILYEVTFDQLRAIYDAKTEKVLTMEGWLKYLWGYYLDADETDAENTTSLESEISDYIKELEGR